MNFLEELGILYACHLIMSYKRYRIVALVELLGIKLLIGVEKKCGTIFKIHNQYIKMINLLTHVTEVRIITVDELFY